VQGMTNAQSTAVSSHRLLIWSLLGLVLLTALGGFIAALPAIAPQFVIAHSPWIWPVLRAEAYETEGKEPDLHLDPDPSDRNSLEERIYHEEDWEQTSIPVLTQALGHPDVRMRRTAAQCLHTLLTDNNARTPVIQDGELVNHLRHLLDDPDEEVFHHAFGLLLAHEDRSSAQAVLTHLPRKCQLVPVRISKPWDIRFSVFWGFEGEPHPMRFLHLAPVVDQAQQWLATGDPEFARLALMVLGWANDVRALPILDAHLGKHAETDASGFGGYWDPASSALSRSTFAGVDDLLTAAMADPDPLRRRSAAGALRSREGHGTIDVSLALLRAHIDDPDEGVRNAVAIGLANYPLEQTFPDIHRIIARGGQIAISVIDRIRSQRMFLHNRRPWWGRGDVVPAVDPDTPENRALETRIINEFATFVTHPEPAVRFELARYLCSTWESDTERVLRSMADDPDPQVRAEIAAELHAITTRTHRAQATYHSYEAPATSPNGP
jgi:hypothetical protein